ncbi:hypothetical protein O6H91_06G062300 [Diphasiastrum complanatum]|uniref:Uncharacterized protein n=1 Tax=Diphasiastrum complanatum TaxID=34168 RepID=A0ACC2DEE2_DIPCM|nr:hypothetical protein O6H91_06G062300 [Diphasiastrum complanatum]
MEAYRDVCVLSLLLLWVLFMSELSFSVQGIFSGENSAESDQKFVIGLISSNAQVSELKKRVKHYSNENFHGSTQIGRMRTFTRKMLELVAKDDLNRNVNGREGHSLDRSAAYDSPSFTVAEKQASASLHFEATEDSKIFIPNGLDKYLAHDESAKRILFPDNPSSKLESQSSPRPTSEFEVDERLVPTGPDPLHHSTNPQYRIPPQLP